MIAVWCVSNKDKPVELVPQILDTVGEKGSLKLSNKDYSKCVLGSMKLTLEEAICLANTLNSIIDKIEREE